MFDLLQVAIGVKDGSLLVVSPKEWEKFFVFCKRQALLGVGFSAVEKVGSCPKRLVLSWYGIVLQIEKRNLIMTKACREVTEFFAKDGFESCVLKGQGNLQNYPEKLRTRRQPGDIDVWVSPTNDKDPVKQVIDYIGKINRKARPNYLHTEMVWNGNIEVEVHYRPRFLVSPYRNILVQEWFEKQKSTCLGNKTQEGFSIPTTSVNVVYQMIHLFGHYFDEGLGLRQLLDYYYLLKRWYMEGCEGHPMNILNQFGIGKFAAAVMWVLQELFVLPDEYLLCSPNQGEGRKLLSEILQSGNFGQYDQRGASMKNGGMLKHGLWKLKRIMGLFGSYPEMALCEPWFRLWHLGWRKIHR